MSLVAAVLAHQGGWDEVLLILTPIALFAALLWLANRRANAHQREGRAGADSADGATTASGPKGAGGLGERGGPEAPPSPDDGRPKPGPAGPDRTGP